MTALEALRCALMALGHHKLRSGLTALGIIIGTAATIAMLAIGAGARAQVAAQVQSLGSNLLVIVSGNVNQSGVKLGAGAHRHFRTRMPLRSVGSPPFSSDVLPHHRQNSSRCGRRELGNKRFNSGPWVFRSARLDCGKRPCFWSR